MDAKGRKPQQDVEALRAKIAKRRLDAELETASTSNASEDDCEEDGDPMNSAWAVILSPQDLQPFTPPVTSGPEAKHRAAARRARRLASSLLADSVLPYLAIDGTLTKVAVQAEEWTNEFNALTALRRILVHAPLDAPVAPESSPSSPPQIGLSPGDSDVSLTAPCAAEPPPARRIVVIGKGLNEVIIEDGGGSSDEDDEVAVEGSRVAGGMDGEDSVEDEPEEAEGLASEGLAHRLQAVLPLLVESLERLGRNPRLPLATVPRGGVFLTAHRSFWRYCFALFLQFEPCLL